MIYAFSENEMMRLPESWQKIEEKSLGILFNKISILNVKLNLNLFERETRKLFVQSDINNHSFEILIMIDHP